MINYVISVFQQFEDFGSQLISVFQQFEDFGSQLTNHLDMDA